MVNFFNYTTALLSILRRFSLGAFVVSALSLVLNCSGPLSGIMPTVLIAAAVSYIVLAILSLIQQSFLIKWMDMQPDHSPSGILRFFFKYLLLDDIIAPVKEPIDLANHLNSIQYTFLYRLKERLSLLITILFTYAIIAAYVVLWIKGIR